MYNRPTSSLKIKSAQIFNDGLVAFSNGKYISSQTHLLKFIDKNPKHIKALELLGNIAIYLKNHGEACKYFAKIVLLDDTKAAHHYNLGHSLQQLNKNDEALACYNHALELQPNFAHAYSNKAAIYLLKYELTNALECYQKAINIDEQRLDDYINYALVLLELNMPDEALEVCDIAALLGAPPERVFFTKGFIFGRERYDEKAVEQYLQAFNLTPDNPKLSWNLSHIYLRHGLYSKGWPLYEARWENDKTEISKRIYAQPVWLGQTPIAGKTIYIHPEQGLGDTIQFCRYIEDLAALGARVILEVPLPLKKLLKELKGVHVLISVGDIIPDFDFHCPLLSLPLALGMTEHNIPVAKVYIKAPELEVEHWRSKLKHSSQPKVGLVWSGGFHATHLSQRGINNRRNLSLDQLNIFKGLNIDFYSLQKGDPAESEIKQLQADGWDGLKIINYADDLKDFTDTAALIDLLDLVITVDTSTAHLAGAMGKPVWLLNRFDSCWRWEIEGTKTHWYPNMTIFRQMQPHNWNDVLKEVVSQLRLL